MRKTTPKRVFNVLLPVALPPEAKVVIAPEGTKKEKVLETLDKVMTSATFVIAFNATDSMSPFAAQLAHDIKFAFETLPRDVERASRIGSFSIGTKPTTTGGSS